MGRGRGGAKGNNRARPVATPKAWRYDYGGPLLCHFGRVEPREIADDNSALDRVEFECHEIAAQERDTV